MNKFVVLVGRRNGAIRAAKRLELEYLVVDPRAIDQQEIRSCGQPVAVVATTEAAVLPAAILRSDLGLSGLSVDVAHRCTDKLAMKDAIAAAGIRCARYEAIEPGAVDKRRLVASLSLPLVLKTQRGSGSRGTRFVQASEQLPDTVDQPCIVESFVEGVEMSVESMVIDGEPVFVNLTEYTEPAWANLVPAVLPEGVDGEVRAFNKRAIKALDVERGITHLEIFRTAEGPFFGELAARPPGGQIMALIQLAYGFDPWRALLAIEIGQTPDIQAVARQTAGMRFFHPGTGVVRSVKGLDDVRKFRTAQSVVCKLKPGDIVGRRTGTGEHCGYALLAGTTEDVRRDLEALTERLHIEMVPDVGGCIS